MRTSSILLAAGLLALTCACASLDARDAADRAALLALHAAGMEAHRRSDVDMLLKDEAADYVLASRGEISRPTLQERRMFLGPYLAATRFTEYVDATPPIVKVSQDGTLGWVVAHVRAKGEQTTSGGATRPVAFESAWIELYEKRDGVWRRVGNVSNFKG